MDAVLARFMRKNRNEAPEIGMDPGEGRNLLGSGVSRPDPCTFRVLKTRVRARAFMAPDKEK